MKLPTLDELRAMEKAATPGPVTVRELGRKLILTRDDALARLREKNGRMRRRQWARETCMLKKSVLRCLEEEGLIRKTNTSVMLANRSNNRKEQ